MAEEVKRDKKPAKQHRAAKTPEQRQAERRDRFLRLAPKRVNKAIAALTTVAQCGNQAAYSYSPEEASKIIGALADALTQVQDSFSQRSSGKAVFTL